MPMPMLVRCDVIGFRVRGGVDEFVLGQQPADLQQEHSSHCSLQKPISRVASTFILIQRRKACSAAICYRGHFAVLHRSRHVCYYALWDVGQDTPRRASGLHRHNSNLCINIDIREARSNDTRAGTLPCERQRRTSNVSDARTLWLRNHMQYVNTFCSVYILTVSSSMKLHRSINSPYNMQDCKSLHGAAYWQCSRLGGSLPHNQNVSASETSLVEVATSRPLALATVCQVMKRRYIWNGMAATCDCWPHPSSQYLYPSSPIPLSYNIYIRPVYNQKSFTLHTSCPTWESHQ